MRNYWRKAVFMRDCGRAKPAAIWAMRIENPFIARYADVARR